MKERSANLDYLRVMAMLFIVCHHCIINDFGLQDILIETNAVLRISNVAVLAFGNSCVIIGVNIFFLLSGYFGIKFRWEKLVSIIIKTYIIYWIISFVGVITGYLEMDLDFIKHIIDPLDFYWFVITYILLYLCSPLLNMIREQITIEGARKYFIGICVVCFGYGFFIDGKLNINNGYSLLMAMILYILGGILRKWPIKIRFNMGAYFLCAFINTIIVLACYAIGRGNLAWKMYSYNNIIIVLESIIFFILFIKMNETKNEGRLIKALAAGTLTVYLIHSTCWITKIRRIPIIYVIKTKGVIGAILFLPIYAMVICLLGTAVDYLYEIIYEKLLKYRVNKLIKRMEQFLVGLIQTRSHNK